MTPGQVDFGWARSSRGDPRATSPRLSFSLPPPRERSSVTLRRGPLPFCAVKPETAARRSGSASPHARHRQTLACSPVTDTHQPLTAACRFANGIAVCRWFLPDVALSEFAAQGANRHPGATACVTATPCSSWSSTWRFAPRAQLVPPPSLAHDCADARLAHPAAKLRHGSLRRCDRYRLRPLLKHALSQAAALAIETPTPAHSASLDGPSSSARRCAPHQMTSPQTRSFRGQLPRPNLSRTNDLSVHGRSRPFP